MVGYNKVSIHGYFHFRVSLLIIDTMVAGRLKWDELPKVIYIVEDISVDISSP